MIMIKRQLSEHYAESLCTTAQMSAQAYIIIFCSARNHPQRDFTD